MVGDGKKTHRVSLAVMKKNQYAQSRGQSLAQKKKKEELEFDVE